MGPETPVDPKKTSQRYKRRHPNADGFAGNKLGRMNCKKATPGRDMNRNCANNNPTYVVSI